MSTGIYAGTARPGAPPVGSAAAAEATLAAVASRSPSLYIPLTNGQTSDQQGLTVTVNGTPSSLTAPMASGTGVDLGGTADLEVAHSSTFNTASAVAHPYAESEVVVTGWFKINQALADDLCLWRKGGDGGWTTFSCALYAMADGSLRLRARTGKRYVYFWVDGVYFNARLDRSVSASWW